MDLSQAISQPLWKGFENQEREIGDGCDSIENKSTQYSWDYLICYKKYCSKIFVVMLTSKKDKPSLQTVRVEGMAEQMQRLKANKNERGETAEARQGKEVPKEQQPDQEKRQVSWCLKVLYIVMLIALTVFIMAEIFIDHQLKIKNNRKFLHNLEALKAEELAREKERAVDLRNKAQTSIHFSTDDEHLKKQLTQSREQSSKEADKTQMNKVVESSLSKSPAASPFVPNLFQQNPVLQVQDKPQNQLQSQPATTDLKQAANQHEILPRNARTNKVQANQKAGSRAGRVVYGSGITEAILSKARERKKLLNISLDEVSPISIQQIKYYEQKYQTGKYPQLPICVVIPTFNNAKNDRYLANIKSVVMQNYSNYHIVVIDDASTDQTGELILNFLRSQNKVGEDRYEVIRNSQQMRAMSNIHFAANTYCKPNEIFMIVDGDDELIGRQVFKFYSAKFQADDLWFMYSNFLTVAGRAGYSRPFPEHIIAENKYRTYPFITSHLRAFYTQLFLNIKEEDLKDQNGEYLKAANDVAICIPVLQQAHNHVEYAPEVTYFYNSNTGLNNHVLRLREQRTNDKKIRLRPKYKQLKSLLPNQ